MKNPNNYREFVRKSKLKNELDPRRSFSYDLHIYKDDFRFTLAIPPGQIIEDDFDGLYKRATLYKQMEEGEIFEWICEVHKSILEENGKRRTSLSSSIPRN